MIGQRQEIARLQSDLYRDRYYKILRSLHLLAWLIVFLVAIVIYLVLSTRTPPYYGSTTAGQIIPMPPISAAKGSQ